MYYIIYHISLKYLVPVLHVSKHLSYYHFLPHPFRQHGL